MTDRGTRGFLYDFGFKLGVWAIIIFVLGIPIASGLSYTIGSFRSPVVIDGSCILLDSIDVRGLMVTGRLKCGHRKVDVMAVKRNGILYYVATKRSTRLYDTLEDKGRIVLLFKVADRSPCGYHYEVVDASSTMTHMGSVSQCTPLIRMNVFKDSLYILTPSPDLRDGYLQTQVFSFKIKPK